MDISGLSSVTTAAEMVTWLTDNCVTPIRPAMSGEDFAAIIQKVIEVADGTTDIGAYLKSLPGYVGDGSKVLSDDLTWRLAPAVDTLDAPSLAIDTIGQTDIETSWNSPPNATGYILQRASDVNFTVDVSIVYSGSANQFDDTGLTPSTEYWYRIKCTAAGYTDSAYSNVVNGTTSANPSNGIAKIVFTNTGPVSEPNWNNFETVDYKFGYNGWSKPTAQEGVSPYLTSSNGGTTPWKLGISLDTQFLYNSDANPNVRSSADFPDDVLITQWVNPNGDVGSTINFNFSGLDPSKTYEIKTLHHDGGDSLSITVTWNGNSLTGDQAFFDGSYFVPLDLAFANVVPDIGGNITGTVVVNAAGSAVINGIIISEN